MRLSMTPSDEGYTKWLHLRREGKSADVYCNNRKMRHVITADTEEGYVRYFCILQKTVRSGHCAMVTEVYGDVRIEIR